MMVKVRKGLICAASLFASILKEKLVSASDLDNLYWTIFFTKAFNMVEVLKDSFCNLKKGEKKSPF